MSLQGVRSAAVRAPLSADPLFVWDHQPLRVSVAFRSRHRHGTLIRSGSQVNRRELQQMIQSLPNPFVSLVLQASVHHFRLSLADGYAVFTSDNYTLRSDRRCSDGGWHYLSASRSSAG